MILYGMITIFHPSISQFRRVPDFLAHFEAEHMSYVTQDAIVDDGDDAQFQTFQIQGIVKEPGGSSDDGEGHRERCREFHDFYR